jgi:hypothetical protein
MAEPLLGSEQFATADKEGGHRRSRTAGGRVAVVR